MRDGDLKFLKILDNTFLFDVVADPLERANLKDRRKDDYRRLERRVARLERDDAAGDRRRASPTGSAARIWPITTARSSPSQEPDVPTAPED